MAPTKTLARLHVLNEMRKSRPKTTRNFGRLEKATKKIFLEDPDGRCDTAQDQEARPALSPPALRARTPRMGNREAKEGRFCFLRREKERRDLDQ